jgi:hypothetical protein
MMPAGYKKRAGELAEEVNNLTDAYLIIRDNNELLTRELAVTQEQVTGLKESVDSMSRQFSRMTVEVAEELERAKLLNQTGVNDIQDLNDMSFRQKLDWMREGVVALAKAGESLGSDLSTLENAVARARTARTGTTVARVEPKAETRPTARSGSVSPSRRGAVRSPSRSADNQRAGVREFKLGSPLRNERTTSSPIESATAVSFEAMKLPETSEEARRGLLGKKSSKKDGKSEGDSSLGLRDLFKSSGERGSSPSR